MFISEIWFFNWYFPQFANLICRSTDISKCFRGSLRLRDNESRLYLTVGFWLCLYFTVVETVTKYSGICVLISLYQ